MKVSLKRHGTMPVASVLLLVCLGVLASVTSAQTNNATVTGIVKDQSGAAIVGATLIATNVQTGIEKSVVSDQEGRYTILSLTPGFYDIRAAQTGFATASRKNQELLVGTTLSIDFTLNVSSSTQTVEVSSADVQVMDTTESTVSRVLETKEIDDLPVLNRNFAQLAVLAPGVQSSGVSYGGSSSVTSASISIGGAPAYSTAYVMDGMSYETNNQGGPYTQVAQDWVQEFSVLALQFPAEYGAASGGVVNVITRSGTNQTHGRGYGFFQNAIFNSNPEFYTGTSKAPFNSERVGGMVGGPIKKDKLFYFAGFEYFHNVSTVSIGKGPTTGAFAATAQPVGTPANELVPYLVYGTQTSGPVTLGSRLAMFRLDYTPNSKNAFRLRSNLEYEYTGNSGLGGAGTFGYAYNSFAPNYGENLNWTRTISPSSVNEVNFGYFSRWTSDTPNYWKAKGPYAGVTPNPNPYNYPTAFSQYGQSIFGNPSGNFAGASYTGVSVGGTGCPCGELNADESGLITDTFTQTRGKHEVKMGGSIRRVIGMSNQGHDLTDPRYTFAGSAGPFNPNVTIAQTFTSAGFAAAEAKAPLSVLVGFSTPALLNFSFPSYALGAFGEDSWKVRSNLTLNFGLRYDFSNINSSLSKASFPPLASAVPGSKGFIQPGFHAINNDPTDIAPRFGFAWTPFHDNQRTVLRGGFGIFYDQNNTASQEVYIVANSEILYSSSLAANVATKNPYCIGNTSCNAGIPVADEFAVLEVMGAALADFTLPAFPTSTAPCAVSNSCTVTLGPNTYNIPALTVPFNPQGGISDIAPNMKTPGVLQMTVGFQHEFTDTFNASADFVYRRGFNELVSVNPNVALTGTGTTASTSYVTVNPAFTQIQQFQSAAYFIAKDLDVQAHYRDHRGDALQVSYQFGYSNDDDYTNFALSGLNALTTDPFNPKVDWGPSSDDARHILNISGALNMYWGIQLAPIMAFTSALPYTATSSLQAPGTSLAPPDCLAYFTRCYPAGYSRDSVRGGNFFSLSTRVSKQVRLAEGKTLTILIEGYNVTNRHNLGTNFFASVDPSNGFPNGNIGTPNGTSLPLRQLQLGARFDF